MLLMPRISRFSGIAQTSRIWLHGVSFREFYIENARVDLNATDYRTARHAQAASLPESEQFIVSRHFR